MPGSTFRKKKVVKEDGRYLIFYNFPREQEQLPAEEDSPRPPEDTAERRPVGPTKP